MREIRILVLGDEGVGKTSIISTIMSESFPKNPPKKIPPVCIPPDMFVQYKDISTILLDSSQDVSDNEIERANVILLVYDVVLQETKSRLEMYWLPKIQAVSEEIPIILVGNKVDMRPSHFDIDLEDILTPLIMKFKQLEMGIECSAKAYMKLIDVVFCAQRAVLFPIAPLQDPITKELTEKFEKALLRIFRIWDKDFDGYLDDWEIGDLQTNVFSSDLLPCHIDGLKEFLYLKCKDEQYSKEDVEKGLNFEAFKMLQTIFIKKMKLQTSWLILEHFCYNEKLRISEEYLVDTKTRLREENEQWEGIELSDIAKEYLTKLYDKYENSKGYLNHDDLEDIFQTTIEGIPWEIEEITNISKNYHIDLKTWIGLWQKAFSEDYASAYELIVYLGFCEPFDSTVDIKIERQDALLSQSGKTVFNCFIIGKNWTSRSYVTDTIIMNKKPAYLVFTEFDSKCTMEELIKDQRKLNYCDVICLIYDGSEKSFKFISEVKDSLPKEIAKVVIKISEGDNLSGMIPSEEIANELKTSQFLEVSPQVSEERKEMVAHPSSLDVILSSKDALEMISSTALCPSKGVDTNLVDQLREEVASKNHQKYALIFGSVTIALGCLFYFGKKHLTDLVKS